MRGLPEDAGLTSAARPGELGGPRPDRRGERSLAADTAAAEDAGSAEAEAACLVHGDCDHTCPKLPESAAGCCFEDDAHGGGGADTGADDSGHVHEDDPAHDDDES